ncbi:hypothetical protein GCM10017711_01610 [Paeniglutamicibacter sulfureus]
MADVVVGQWVYGVYVRAPCRARANTVMLVIYQDYLIPLIRARPHTVRQIAHACDRSHSGGGFSVRPRDRRGRPGAHIYYRG